MDFFSQQFGEYSSMGLAVLSLILLGFPLWKMSERTKDEPRWFAWVPFLNGLLMLKIARKPMWWILLFLVPLVNFVMLILLSMALCERFRVNKWWGLLGFITPANIVLLYYLAYATENISTSEAKPAMADAQPVAPAPEAPKPAATPTEDKPPQTPQQ